MQLKLQKLVHFNLMTILGQAGHQANIALPSTKSQQAETSAFHLRDYRKVPSQGELDKTCPLLDINEILPVLLVLTETKKRD